MRGPHDYDAIWRADGPTLWRAVYAFSGGRRDVADDAVAEAFARAMARDADVRDPRAYVYRIAFRVAGAEMARLRREASDMPEVAVPDPTQNGLPDLMRALSELTPASARPCTCTIAPTFPCVRWRTSWVLRVRP